MQIGVPREIKPQEYRVGLAPAAVAMLASAGHTLLIESGAGSALGFADDAYRTAGAQIVPNAATVFAKADLIIKVKEPQAEEIGQLRGGQILFTYLHLAASRALTVGLMETGCVAIAYETVSAPDGSLPLLAPMSEIAGRLAIPAGAQALQKHQGGRGLLLGGVPGVAPARVLIIGGGVVGREAARMALGLGAQVTILDRSLPRLRQLDGEFAGRAVTLLATPAQILDQARQSDLIIGAVLLPGAAAPKLLDAAAVASLRPGTVLVDVAIDQGGCFATSRPTTHEQPTYIVDGIVHYCVANMPGAVPLTATQALNNATLPYIQKLADQGLVALRDDRGLAAGLAIHRGDLLCPATAAAHRLPHRPFDPSQLA